MLLIENGANIDAIGDMGETPLHVGISKNEKRAIDALLEAGTRTGIVSEFGLLKFKRDEEIVTKFLKNSGVNNSHTFKTTNAISSATNLSKERIRNVCSKSSRIRRNQKEKGLWKLY